MSDFDLQALYAAPDVQRIAATRAITVNVTAVHLAAVHLARRRLRQVAATCSPVLTLPRGPHRRCHAVTAASAPRNRCVWVPCTST